MKSFSSVSSFQASACPVTNWNSNHIHICWIYLSYTKRDWRSQHFHTCPFSRPAVNSSSSKTEADGPSLSSAYLPSIQEDDGLHSEGNLLIFPPGPITISLFASDTPLQNHPPYSPTQYLWLFSMHRLNPFDPAVPLGITYSLREWRELKAKGGSTFCASKPQTL